MKVILYDMGSSDKWAYIMTPEQYRLLRELADSELLNSDIDIIKADDEDFVHLDFPTPLDN